MRGNLRGGSRGGFRGRGGGYSGRGEFGGEIYAGNSGAPPGSLCVAEALEEQEEASRPGSPHLGMQQSRVNPTELRAMLLAQCLCLRCHKPGHL